MNNARYFYSLKDAYARRKSEGWKQRPRKRVVWIRHMGWERVWSLDPALS